jgi:hypothetical protein
MIRPLLTAATIDGLLTGGAAVLLGIQGAAQTAGPVIVGTLSLTGDASLEAAARIECSMT